VTLAAQAKTFAVDTAIWGLDQCVRAVGAAGASANLRLAMHQSEVRMAAYGDGTSEILLDRIGRGLAKDYPMRPEGL
ncbi:acyl-CoA dehydrogenase family protein, partial [Acinetobacter baumannii]